MLSSFLPFSAEPPSSFLAVFLVRVAVGSSFAGLPAEVTTGSSRACCVWLTGALLTRDRVRRESAGVTCGENIFSFDAVRKTALSSCCLLTSENLGLARRALSSHWRKALSIKSFGVRSSRHGDSIFYWVHKVGIKAR